MRKLMYPIIVLALLFFGCGKDNIVLDPELEKVGNIQTFITANANDFANKSDLVSWSVDRLIIQDIYGEAYNHEVAFTTSDWSALYQSVYSTNLVGEEVEVAKSNFNKIFQGLTTTTIDITTLLLKDTDGKFARSLPQQEFVLTYNDKRIIGTNN